MDWFLKINWNKGVDENSFFTEDVFVKSSAAYHSMHGLNQSPWPDEQCAAKKPTEWTATSLKRIPVQGTASTKGKHFIGKMFKIDLPKCFPRLSVLTEVEQRNYMFSLIRVLGSCIEQRPYDPNDICVIKEYQERLREEIEDYQKLAQTAILENPGTYNILSPEINKYVSEAWLAQLNRPRKYSRYYKAHGLALLIPKEKMITLDLVLEKKVLEMGWIRTHKYHSPDSVIRLPRTYNIINRHLPAQSDDYHPVSRDPNTTRIAAKHDVSIVMSSCTMKTLVGSVGPIFKASWEIPFFVRNVKVKGEMKKIIYIDEALPPKTMSAIEKNIFFNNVATKHHFTNFNKQHHPYPGSEQLYSRQALNKQNATEESEGFSDPGDIDSTQLETFGISKLASPTGLKMEEGDQEKINKIMPKSSGSKTSDLKMTSTFDSDMTLSDSEGSLQIDLGNESTSPRKSPRKSKTDSETDGAKPNLLSSILRDQQKMMVGGSKTKNHPVVDDKSENMTDYVPPEMNNNVTYRLWSFQANQQSLRLLIRSSVDTAVVKGKNDIQTHILTSKTEFQPWYGAECQTAREMNEQWIDVYLRPESRQISVRLDAYTGHLMMMQNKDYKCLAAEVHLRSGDSLFFHKSLQSVWGVLSSLRDLNLDEGSYLLQHGPRDGVAVQVLIATEKALSSYDLHEAYESVDTSVTVPCDPKESWIALDPWTVLPVQRALNKPPLTFEPAIDDKPRHSTRKAKRGKK